MAAKLVRQAHGFDGFEGLDSSSNNEGTEAQADAELRIDRERVLVKSKN